MSETHDPWKDVTWFVACQHCGATTTRGNLTFSGGLHCARCDDITEMPQEVAYRANIDAARAAEATQHRQEIAAKDETIDGLRLVALGWEKQRDEARARLAAVEAERDRLQRVNECVYEVCGCGNMADAHCMICCRPLTEHRLIPTRELEEIQRRFALYAEDLAERDRLKAAAQAVLDNGTCADPDCCKAAIKHEAALVELRAALSGEGTKP